MRGRTFKTATAALLMASSLPFAATASAVTPSVRTLAAREAHLAGMAYRMAVTNADLCSRPSMMTGLIIHDLTQYHPNRRADVARAFSLGAGFGVLELVRGSAAALGGLRIDDEIIAVNSISVEKRAEGVTNPSFRRVQGFGDVLQTQLAKGAVDLRVRRGGQLLNIKLMGERGCGGELSLANSSSLNAWADGRHIMITTAMTDFAGSDDEIAFVIAHEMAHNMLNHNHRNGKSGFFGSLQSRRTELDADRFAVRIMAAAGYQPAAGISFLERSSRRLWWSFSLSHPGFGARIRMVSQAISSYAQSWPEHREAVQPISPNKYGLTAVQSTAPAL